MFSVLKNSKLAMMQDKLKLSVTKYGLMSQHCHTWAYIAQSNMGKQGASYTGTTKYINIRTVTNFKQKS